MPISGFALLLAAVQRNLRRLHNFAQVSFSIIKEALKVFKVFEGFFVLNASL